ncbi:putative Glutamate receptor-like 77 [Homarus americanus]|uniref:Putative Glutamate receptor-like 77 n=1 Tax=Homarus americanus TaxID=6706 RepID=A0A8J5MSX0_HOMAM|nr:putative Glutamate receptor-like 77 [Homarus americanus]
MRVPINSLLIGTLDLFLCSTFCCQHLLLFSITKNIMERRRRFSQTTLSERARFVSMWAAGASVRTIAQNNSTTTTTVYKWIHRWQKEGNLGKKHNEWRKWKNNKTMDSVAVPVRTQMFPAIPVYTTNTPQVAYWRRVTPYVIPQRKPDYGLFSYDEYLYLLIQLSLLLYAIRKNSRV